MAGTGKVVSGLNLPKAKNEGSDMAENETKPAADDLITQMKKDAAEILRAKNYQKMMFGDNPPPPAPTPTKSEEKVVTNIADMITAIGSLMPKQGTNEGWEKFLLAQVDRLENEKRAINSGQMTPAQALTEQLRISQALDAEIERRSKTVSGGVQASTIGEARIMLELEQMKDDREEKARQHEREMKLIDQRHEDEKADRERRWKIDDEKWRMDYDLKKEEIGTKNDRTDAAVTAFSNIVTALAGSIDMRTGFGQQAKDQPVPAAQFDLATCGTCGTEVQIRPDAHEFTCPKCKMVNTDEPTVGPAEQAGK